MTAFERMRLRYKTPPPTVQVLFSGSPVAELQEVRGAYVFRYLPAFSEMQLAPLPGLPELTKTYQATELFPFFQERIPDMRRPEIRERVRQLGITPGDKLALLGQLGRTSVTDSFELRFTRAA